MRSLAARLKALEGNGVRTFAPWVRVLQDIGQTEETAIAAYEAQHSLMGNRNVILRVLV